MSEVTILQEMDKMDLDRKKRYAEYLTFYQGIQWPRPKRTGTKELTFNYAKVFCDKITSYLMYDLAIAVDDLSKTDAGALKAVEAEDYLRLVADANDLPALDYETEVDCSILGDGAYKVFWDGAQVRISTPMFRVFTSG